MRQATTSLLSVLLLCFLFASGGLALAGAAEMADETPRWAQFRGPDGQGIAEGTVPTDWSKPGAVLWKAPIEGRGLSSPVLWGDLIFLTTAIEGEVIAGAAAPTHHFGGQEFVHPDSVGVEHSHTLKVIALDATSGERVWERTAYEGRVYDNRHRASSYASPTTVTDGTTVFAYFGSEGMYAYDFEGELRWKRDIGDIKTVGLGVGTSPVLFGDLLIIQADDNSGDESFLVALDTASGEERWRVERPVQASWTTPVVIAAEADRAAQLITAGNEWVISYDPASGKEIWRAAGLENNTIHVPLIGDDRVIVSSGYPRKVIKALRLDPEVADDERLIWEYNKGTGYVVPNLLYRDRLYLFGDNGMITALDPADGSVVYEGGRVPPEVQGRFMASPLIADGKIMLLSQDGDAAFVATGDEHQVVAVTGIDEPVLGSPAIAGNRIYIRGQEHLIAIGEH